MRSWNGLPRYFALVAAVFHLTAGLSAADRIPLETFATVPCRSLFAGLPIKNTLPDDLSHLDPEVQALLRGAPPELLGNRPPSINWIRSSHPEDWAAKFGDDSEERKHWWRHNNEIRPLLTPEAVREMLRVFQAAPGQAHFYFVGNQALPLYVLAKAFFEGTPLADSIHFLPLSRRLSIPENETERTALRAYFSNGGLAVPADGKMVVVDWVSRADRTHALPALVKEIGSYAGKPERVMGVGMPEVPGGPIPAGIVNAGVSPAISTACMRAPRWQGFHKTPHGKFSVYDADGNPDYPDYELPERVAGRRNHVGQHIWAFRSFLQSRIDCLAFIQDLDTLGRAQRANPTFTKIRDEILAARTKP